MTRPRPKPAGPAPPCKTGVRRPRNGSAGEQSARRRPDAGKDFAPVRGLGNEVVRADLERDDLFGLLPAAGQDEDRDAGRAPEQGDIVEQVTGSDGQVGDDHQSVVTALHDVERRGETLGFQDVEPIRPNIAGKLGAIRDVVVEHQHRREGGRFGRAIGGPGIAREIAPGVVREIAPGIVRKIAPGIVRKIAPGIVRKIARQSGRCMARLDHARSQRYRAGCDGLTIRGLATCDVSRLLHVVFTIVSICHRTPLSCRCGTAG